MIPFEELGARWQGFVNEKQTEMPNYMGTIVGSSATAMIQSRVQKGQRADGGTFKPYSIKPTLVGSSSFVTKGAAEKVFGSKQKRKDADWVSIYNGGKLNRLMVLPGGYAQIRDLEGRQTLHKDFERTSAMWKSTGVMRQWEYNVSVGGRNEDAIMKLEENAANEGISLLQLSPGEEQELADMLAEKLKQNFEQWFT